MNIKSIILNALAERSPMKAKELKAVIEAKIGRKVHYKTPGVTLYRLAENDLVRRDFHDWSITDKGKLSLDDQITDDGSQAAFWIEMTNLSEKLTIPMILFCPNCGERHIDEGEFATVVHHTHACQGCGLVWRPAKVNTHGVRFLPGYRNGQAR